MSPPVLFTQAGYFQMSATHSFPPISTTVAGFCVGSGSARKYVTICVASLGGSVQRRNGWQGAVIWALPDTR